MLESMRGNSKRIPPLPKPDKKVDWSAFWRVMKHWLTKSKFSPGKIAKLQHVTSADEFNNEVASKNVSDTLFLIMTEDAVATFEYQGHTYTDKGFKMLSVLKKDWNSSSTTQIFKQCFNFFQDFPQGEKSPDA